MRRRRRDEVVTYRLRIELDDADPLVWRVVDVASDLTLDVLHHVVQVAMGWTDSHLHGFSSEDPRFHPGAEVYLSEIDLAEGEEGVPEREVRLDEVLQDVGGELFDEYDFGDGWAHTLRLEAVQPRHGDDPPAACVEGARACPPEDLVRELDLGREWIGAGNRENHTLPVLELRENAQRLGLLRKHSGRLLVTASGRAAVDDPEARWRHLAQRLPLGRGRCETDAGTVVLLVAASSDPGLRVADVVALVLHSIGWRTAQGRRLPPWGAMRQAEATWEVLRRLGVDCDWTTGEVRATPAARVLARDALTSVR